MLLPIRGLVTTKTLILSFLPLFGELISNVFFFNFESTALEVAGCILPFRQLFKFFLPGQLSFIMTMMIPLFSVFVFVIVLCLKKCKKLDNGQNRLRIGGSCEKAPRHFV